MIKLAYIAALAAVSTSITPQQRVKVFSRSFGPQNTVLHARPQIRWEIWPESPSQITAVTLTINGQPADAKYVASERSLVAEVPSALSGRVEIDAKITVDNKSRFSKQWSFDVAPNAIADLPGPTELQSKLLGAVNAYRKKLGLPPFTFDARFALAAQRHADYLAQNKLKGHMQISTKPGFLGQSPMDRAQAFGWVSGVWEGLSFDFENPIDGVKVVFDAPYHRMPFMQPGPAVVGLAVNGAILCIDGQVNDAIGTVVSPADGEANVPIAWEDLEKPDPLRIWSDARRPIGYAIVFHQNDAASKKLTVNTATLTTGGKPVPFYLNTADNDNNLTTTAVILPKDPLEYGTAYTVSISAVDDRGIKLEKTWTFNTEPRPK